ALFLTYDEHGGYFDHVPPPAAPLPSPDPNNPGQDLHPPTPSDQPYGTFDRYGFRVPVAVVSPFAKQHFVSHNVHDHTSILHFIETRFGLPSLTNRTALADPMLEFFDFANPSFSTPPSLITPPVDTSRPECDEAPPDGDLDGDPDPFDNCPTTPNADQADHDVRVSKFSTGGRDLGLGADGTVLRQVLARCQNLSHHTDIMRCSVEIVGLPSGCTAQNVDTGASVASPEGLLVDDVSSYVPALEKKFDFKTRIACASPQNAALALIARAD